MNAATTQTAPCRTQAFTDDKGNRFIFPSLITWPDGSGPAGYDVTLKSMTLSCLLNLKLDKDRFEFDPKAFPHVVSTACHLSFAHGGATVWIFAGPEFDAVADEAGAA